MLLGRSFGCRRFFKTPSHTQGSRKAATGGPYADRACALCLPQGVPHTARPPYGHHRAALRLLNAPVEFLLPAPFLFVFVIYFAAYASVTFALRLGYGGRNPPIFAAAADYLRWPQGDPRAYPIFYMP